LLLLMCYKNHSRLEELQYILPVWHIWMIWGMGHRGMPRE
jgi:hypothetical protein